MINIGRNTYTARRSLRLKEKQRIQYFPYRRKQKIKKKSYYCEKCNTMRDSEKCEKCDNQLFGDDDDIEEDSKVDQLFDPNSRVVYKCETCNVYRDINYCFKCDKDLIKSEDASKLHNHYETTETNSESMTIDSQDDLKMDDSSGTDEVPDESKTM